MIAVIFEFEPVDGQQQAYLDIAAKLRPILEEIDGFISVERFQSLSDPSKLLSLSYFRDEKAVLQWRNQLAHREAQTSARDSIFANYSLRVAQIIRDYTVEDRSQAPKDSTQTHGS